MKNFIFAVVICLGIGSFVQADCCSTRRTPVRGAVQYFAYNKPVRTALFYNKYGEVRQPVRNSISYFVNEKPVRSFVFYNKYGHVRRPIRNTVILFQPYRYFYR